jgi:hypothetical protein
LISYMTYMYDIDIVNVSFYRSDFYTVHRVFTLYLCNLVFYMYSELSSLLIVLLLLTG